jgi:hypothetical protein
MLGRRLAGTTGTPCVTTLPPGDLSAVDGHDRYHHHVGVGQDLGGLVSFEFHRLEECGGQWVAAMPQPPRGVEPEAPSILLESITNTPAGPITKWSMLARLPGTARSCRTTHP